MQTQTIQELQAERVKLKDQIKAKWEQSRTVPASELGKVALEIAQLEAQDKLLGTNIDVLARINRQREDAEKAEARKKAEDAVAKPRLERIDWLKENPEKVLCPSCGFPAKIEASSQPPMSVLGNKNTRILFTYTCENPSLASGRHRFCVNVDEDLELKPRKKSGRLTDGYMPQAG
jgi:hypothetical protein